MTLEECEERLAILNSRLVDITEEQIQLSREYNERDRVLSDKYWDLLAELIRIGDIKETLQ